jgi:hypothetical protein
MEEKTKEEMEKKTKEEAEEKTTAHEGEDEGRDGDRGEDE